MVENQRRIVFMQEVTIALYQTRRNTFFEILLSSYSDKKNSNLILILTTKNNTTVLFKSFQIFRSIEK